MRTIQEVLEAMERVKDKDLNDSTFVNDPDYIQRVTETDSLLRACITICYHTFIDKIRPYLEDESRFMLLAAMVDELLDELFTDKP